MSTEPAPLGVEVEIGASAASLDELRRELTALRERVAALEESAPQNRLSLVVCSGSLDRVLAAFTMATAAAASGMEVELFFTFWGLSALRDPKKRVDKGPIEKLFGWMLPTGMDQLPLAHFNFFGLGARMMKAIMQRKRLASLDELLQIAAEQGVVLSACDTSMIALGISQAELIEYPHLQRCGAARFIERASGGRLSLFL